MTKEKRRNTVKVWAEWRADEGNTEFSGMFPSEMQIAQTIKENLDMEDKLSKITKIAKDLIDFYGNKHNWANKWHKSELTEGIIHYKDLSHVGMSCDVELSGGKLAREKEEELEEILNEKQRTN